MVWIQHIRTKIGLFSIISNDIKSLVLRHHQTKPIGVFKKCFDMFIEIVMLDLVRCFNFIFSQCLRQHNEHLRGESVHDHEKTDIFQLHNKPRYYVLWPVHVLVYNHALLLGSVMHGTDLIVLLCAKKLVLESG